MVSAENGKVGHTGVVGEHRISTVVPASVTGENVVHKLSTADLLMKLHYLRGVYYFRSDGGALEGLDVPAFKPPMFGLLDSYHAAAGRVRWSDAGGRPFVKCNDGGVRILEARCAATLDEWLQEAAAARWTCSRHRLMAPDKVIGPGVLFSPLVHIQFTWFKCGGLAVGISWSHALGDAATTVGFLNMWGQLLIKPHHLQKNSPAESEEQARAAPAKAGPPLSIKQVEPLEDRWLPTNNCKMQSLTFQISKSKLKHLKSKISGSSRISAFEAISAVIWQCLAKIRGGNEPRIVTICKANSSGRSWILGNKQIIGTVRADFSPAGGELSELANLLAEGFVDESEAIERQLDEESGAPDFIVYGANLTFVDLEAVDVYGLELKGHKPILVNYDIDGVGDEGAVLVLPEPRTKAAEDSDLSGGRVVNVIIPEDQVLHLRKELERDWCIA